MEEKAYPEDKMKEIHKLAIGLSVILLITGGLILSLAMPLASSRTAVLDTRPVDPFDVFRGQYMSINYEISWIPAIKTAEQGDAVYVILKEDKDKISRYESTSLSKPKEQNFIKGIVRENNGENLRVEYGIEQYFFERDAYISQANLTVEVKIGKSGQARIMQLLQLGKPAKIEYEEPRLTD